MMSSFNLGYGPGVDFWDRYEVSMVLVACLEQQLDSFWKTRHSSITSHWLVFVLTPRHQLIEFSPKLQKGRRIPASIDTVYPCP